MANVLDKIIEDKKESLKLIKKTNSLDSLENTIKSLNILLNFNNVYSSIIGFSLLGIGASSIVPIAYSLAGKIKGIDSGVGITIISIAVYGTFVGAPASLGYIANNYGINFIFVPMIIVFFILLIPIGLFRKKFLF